MFHVIIAKENRTSTLDNPRNLAIPINTSVFTQTGVGANGMPVGTTTISADQLHDLGVTIQTLANPNLLAVIEWDMVSPYVVVHKGLLSDYKMAYAGWPMIDQATWTAQQPIVPKVVL